MTNPYPANFETLEGGGRLTGQVNFTDPANQPSGSSYTPPTSLAKYDGVTAVADNTDVLLDWTFSAGAALLNLTAPTHPTIVTAGIYALTVRWTGTFVVFAAKTLNLGLEMDASGFDANANLTRPMGASVDGFFQETAALIAYCPAGADLQTDVYQDSGASVNVDFRAFLQRIT